MQDQKKYFATINISSIIDNKKCWKTVKPLFLDKTSHKDNQVVGYFNGFVKNLLMVTNKN